jgi:2,4-dienoyl-CoA reductase-like NADH-dependent reductase (Old Yellow Enzyme family)
MTDNLFQSFSLNDTIELSNRILMAPLTRCMADDDLVPTQAMADYYGRRAEAGLIISEAVIIRLDGQGYPNTPGLFTQQQITAWRKVTAAVHQSGGKIFAQLWHTGRVAHPHFFGGKVLAPSALAVEGSVPRMRELTYQIPKAVTESDIQQLISDYAQAAENAIEAGFDGVEIHGANGYLIDQLLHCDSNIRDD